MENAKIVIVDDDEDIRDALQTILESRQYTVVTAANKTDGIETIRTEKPDLAILDVMMSTWEDGFEMARELKNDPDFKDMPILMLTGIKDKTGFDFESSAGDPAWCPVDGYLRKPVELNMLFSEVEKLLPKKT
jgi:CheY-like chemotaxis protein